MVEKIIKSPDPKEPDEEQIGVEGGEDLYREVRIDNVLKGQNGEDVSLKESAKVDVTIEVHPKDTIKKKE